MYAWAPPLRALIPFIWGRARVLVFYNTTPGVSNMQPGVGTTGLEECQLPENRVPPVV